MLWVISGQKEEFFVFLQIEGLVVVSLNEGVVRFSDSLEILSLPSDPVTVFKEAVNSLMSQMDAWQLEMYVFWFE